MWRPFSLSHQMGQRQQQSFLCGYDTKSHFWTSQPPELRAESFVVYKLASLIILLEQRKWDRAVC